MSLESAKKYGFIASIINVITPVMAILFVVGLTYQILVYPVGEFSSFWSGFSTGVSIAMGAVGVIALILFLLAMHRLSNYYKEPSIFKNVLYSFLITIVGSIIIIIITLGSITTLTNNILLAPNSTDPLAMALQLMISIAAIIGAALIIGIIEAVLYWRAFTKLGEKSGVETFKTAGLLYLIGGVLQIVGVGAILVWIAWIFAARGYKQLQPQPVSSTSNYSPTTTSSNSGKIYCSYCGIENDTNGIYCKHCGKPLYTNQSSV
ncbi:MAG: DUF996 domain-containing protein [Candidatus Bathyarchaeota archaeon]|nr:DUF996 domain-containing protein [Candidatus Termiticorpusculum sp.]